MGAEGPAQTVEYFESSKMSFKITFTVNLIVMKGQVLLEFCELNNYYVRLQSIFDEINGSDHFVRLLEFTFL